MKTTKAKKTKKTTKPTKKKSVKKAQKVATIAKGINIVEKNGTYTITGKNAKLLEGAVVERRERTYHFNEKLVPFHFGGDTKEGDLAIRRALIELGKTQEMTRLFQAMKVGNIDYREEAKETFIKGLAAVIKGHDQSGLTLVYDEDIDAIYNNNLKTFNDFWDALEKKSTFEFEGFSN
jgi:hypothetical protein